MEKTIAHLPWAIWALYSTSIFSEYHKRVKVISSQSEFSCHDNAMGIHVMGAGAAR